MSLRRKTKSDSSIKIPWVVSLSNGYFKVNKTPHLNNRKIRRQSGKRPRNLPEIASPGRRPPNDSLRPQRAPIWLPAGRVWPPRKISSSGGHSGQIGLRPATERKAWRRRDQAKARQGGGTKTRWRWFSGFFQVSRVEIKKATCYSSFCAIISLSHFHRRKDGLPMRDNKRPDGTYWPGLINSNQEEKFLRDRAALYSRQAANSLARMSNILSPYRDMSG